MISDAFKHVVNGYDNSEFDITKTPTSDYLLQKAIPDVPSFNKHYEVALSSFSSQGIRCNGKLFTT